MRIQYKYGIASSLGIAWRYKLQAPCVHLVSSSMFVHPSIGRAKTRRSIKTNRCCTISGASVYAVDQKSEPSLNLSMLPFSTSWKYCNYWTTDRKAKHQYCNCILYYYCSPWSIQYIQYIMTWYGIFSIILSTHTLSLLHFEQTWCSTCTWIATGRFSFVIFWASVGSSKLWRRLRYDFVYVPTLLWRPVGVAAHLTQHDSTWFHDGFNECFDRVRMYGMYCMDCNAMQRDAIPCICFV